MKTRNSVCFRSPGRVAKLVALGAVILFLCFSVRSFGVESVFQGKDLLENPHKEIECDECHTKVPKRGRSTWDEIADGLKGDPVSLCRECHLPGKVQHHPVKVPPGRILPEGLPSSKLGEVICSTCHNVHIEADVPSLLRGFDTGRYQVRMDMCLDCHREQFEDINPHKVGGKSERCYTCHEVMPGEKDTYAEVSFRKESVKICNFCHNVLEKDHPLNVDPLRKLPEELPRDTEGRVNCGTCHNPHGMDATLHFLRREYIAFLEAGRYENPHDLKDYNSCKGCHVEVAKTKEGMRKNLRYGGNDIQICLSCHGAMDACHPILIEPVAGMNPPEDLRLSADGKITCLTCHDPMPENKTGVSLRGRGPGEPINVICKNCHGQMELFARNPHSSMDDRGSCKFCHDTMTDPTNEEAARVSFISNTRLICIRCHPKDQEKHPMGNHMVVPKVEIPEFFKVDFKGKITCTTCHNPHINVTDPEERVGKHRFVVDVTSAAICSLCHDR